MECKDCNIDLSGARGPEALMENRKTGLVLAALLGGGAVLTSAICFPFVSPGFRKICLPYVPATNAQVKNIFKALRNRKGSLIDLGSGDGRIVLEAAKIGYKSFGVELNPWLLVFSKLQALKQGYTNAKFFKKDLFKTNLAHYDNIVIFGVNSMMRDIEAKCAGEMNDKALLAACRFSLPQAKPISIVGEGIDRVWLYDAKSIKSVEDSSIPPSLVKPSQSD